MKTVREKLNNKYYKLPKNKHDKSRNEKDIYDDYIKTLQDLIVEVKKIRKKTVGYMIKDFNYRQKGCMERITKLDNGWRTDLEKFHQSYYEMTDFIYYPGLDYNPISNEELSVIEIMATYLISRANENITKL